MAESTQRPADIVSPITSSALPDKVSAAADARKAGRFGYGKPTAANSIVLLIDHQIGLMAACATPLRWLNSRLMRSVWRALPRP